MPNFVMLVGLPGSGKSYIAYKLSKMDYNVHSSDDIREELSGDVNNQDINQKVFNILHSRVKEDLRANKNCVYDATNISYKRRKAFLEELKSIDCKKYCVVIATPYEVCVTQNGMRDRRVPEYIIEKMHRNFDIPFYEEGWDEIVLHYNKESYKTLYGSWSQFIYDTWGYNQDTPHHLLTLGEHSKRCGDACGEENWNLYIAGMLHDCGKPFCRTFKNTKGEIDDKAHYYNHENVGSYNSLFYDIENTDLNDRLYIAKLIRWHMQPYFIEKQPHTLKKYENMFNKEFWNDLIKLHDSDKKAH